MLTAKRLYLYGVLLVSLVLLLWGLTDMLRFAFDELAQAVGTAPALGGSFAREELSRALALVIVAGAIFAVHLVLVGRTLRGSAADVADERASASRATYFFLVLAGTGIAFGWSLFSLAYELISTVAFDERGRDLIGPAGGAIVIGSAWLAHLVVRRGDLRSAPERTAGDWLTRGYLYGALFATFLVGAMSAADMLTVVARQVLDLQPAWESYRWWQEAITGPVAGTMVASAGWLSHWFFADRLLRAPDPMGEAHRSARTRRGYFLAVVAVSATAVLVFTSMSLRDVFAEVLGVWRSSEGSRLVEDIGGPLLMIVPFALAWWWHLHRVSREALVLGGDVGGRAVALTGRLAVAFVGLAGLAGGLAWQLQALFDAVGSSSRVSLFTSSDSGDAGTSALALALVGLVLWTPAWALAQRDRVRFTVEDATATSRRAYLMLVSGLSVLAAMGSLAYLVWQATRVLLESGGVDDASWAFAILVVSVLVLAYHIWQLSSDLAVARVHEDGVRRTAASRATEIIEISAPAGADFRVLNAAIRSELPEGYELQVVTRAR
jgi:hypothetical protein